jgi:hypothetical protein
MDQELEDFEPVLIGTGYSKPGAIIAAMQAAAYGALAARERANPAKVHPLLPPRIAHYERMARIWHSSAEMFEASKSGPSGSVSW